MQTLLLKIIGDKAFLSEEHALSINSISMEEWVKRFYKDACWLIEVTGYNSNQKKITAEILDYNHADIPFPLNQLKYLENNSITNISFRHLDTDKFLKFTTPAQTQSPINVLALPKAQIGKKHTLIKRHNYTIPIKNFRFGFGNVATDIYIEELRKEVEIKIFNIEIRPEFDAIKNYFSNILKTKKFDVDVELTIEGNEVTDKKAFSPQVELINKAMIETIRFEFIQKSFLKKRIDIDVNILTAEAMFEHFSPTKSSAFYDNEKQLFDDLLSIKNAKHYRQLRYLSSLHAHDILKLRFVLKPFSFIFLIKGQAKFHIVWETLDTEEATYIWHTDRNIASLKQKLKEVDLLLNTIKVHGKTVYLNERPEGFTSVIHDYKSVSDGFIKWKSDIDQRLI